jgi:programmed cell death protein 5
MEDTELDELRRRKMAELQRQQQQQVAVDEQRRQIEEQRAALMRRILTPEARDRMGNLRVAYPDLARAVEDQLIRLIQAGQITEAVDDATLKEILRRVAPHKREINIERR